MKRAKKELKWGYSTGACMSALALGAWHSIRTGTFLKTVELYFLDGQVKQVPLLDPDTSGTVPLIRIKKDGGDDPDCTHGMILTASMQEVCSEKENKAKEDYILTIGKDILILHAVEGIGICTRIGLDAEVGHWAINKAPREMLTKNLELAGFGKKDEKSKIWLFSLSAENGEEKAKNTLNPLLGVIGGISILGTTGHVRPYSNAAYIDTIRICLRTQNIISSEHVVFSTGGRTEKTAKAYYTELNEYSFVSIADFIAESIKLAQEYGMKKVTIACMSGKLCKYAARLEYTHAHKTKQDIQLLKQEILKAFKKSGVEPDKTLTENLSCIQSVREALHYLDEKTKHFVILGLSEKALDFFRSLAPSIDFNLLVCDFDGRVIIDYS